MSNQGIYSDPDCPSLGYRQNPPRGYHKSVRTCFKVSGGKSSTSCRTVALVDVTDFATTATARGVSNVTYNGISGYTITLVASSLDGLTSPSRVVTGVLKNDTDLRLTASLSSDQTQITVVFYDKDGVQVANPNEGFFLHVNECNGVAQVGEPLIL